MSTLTGRRSRGVCEKTWPDRTATIGEEGRLRTVLFHSGRYSSGRLGLGAALLRVWVAEAPCCFDVRVKGCQSMFATWSVATVRPLFAANVVIMTRAELQWVSYCFWWCDHRAANTLDPVSCLSFFPSSERQIVKLLTTSISALFFWRKFCEVCKRFRQKVWMEFLAEPVDRRLSQWQYLLTVPVGFPVCRTDTALSAVSAFWLKQRQHKVSGELAECCAQCACALKTYKCRTARFGRVSHWAGTGRGWAVQHCLQAVLVVTLDYRLGG